MPPWHSHDHSPTPGLLAGAGRSLIAIAESLYPIDGFGWEHDPLEVRVLLLSYKNERVALVVVDLTSISGRTVAKLRQLAHEAAGVPLSNVIIAASHTFSAPHILPEHVLDPDQRDRNSKLETAVGAAVADSVHTALASLRPATLATTTGTSGVNVNRDVEGPDGWWLGADEAGFSDRDITVIAVQDGNDRPIALLTNYAVQPSVMNDSTDHGARPVSADLAGAAMRHLERALPGTVAMFLIGAAGDQAPRYTAVRSRRSQDCEAETVDAGTAGFLLVEAQGERLGEDVLRSLPGLVPVSARLDIEVAHETTRVPGQVLLPRPRIRPTRSYTFAPAEDQDVPVVFVRIGDAILVGTQAELASTTGKWIRTASPFQATMVATMVNGAAKYLPDARSYDRITYEAMSSKYARGAAEQVAEGAIKRLLAMHHRVRL